MVRTMTIDDYDEVYALWMSIHGFGIRSIDDTKEGVEMFLKRNPTTSAVDVEDGKIVGEQVVDTNGSGHGALAGFLQAARVDALICGGIGMGAQMALADAGIRLYAGVQGPADVAAKALAEGTLEYDPNARCDHHEHHGGDCGHDHCAEHHCHGN